MPIKNLFMPMTQLLSGAIEGRLKMNDDGHPIFQAGHKRLFLDPDSVKDLVTSGDLNAFSDEKMYQISDAGNIRLGELQRMDLGSVSDFLIAQEDEILQKFLILCGYQFQISYKIYGIDGGEDTDINGVDKPLRRQFIKPVSEILERNYSITGLACCKPSSENKRTQYISSWGRDPRAFLQAACAEAWSRLPKTLREKNGEKAILGL